MANSIVRQIIGEMPAKTNDKKLAEELAKKLSPEAIVNHKCDGKKY